MYRVMIKPKAEREFGKLLKKSQKRFYEEFKKLSINPFVLPQLKKIEGAKRGYRLRIGRWRILFALFSERKHIEVVDIFLKKGKADYTKRLKLSA
jgi:mRNA-degrading endonuclease RelE of RelBE toxin-antitoxin system